MKEVRTAAVQAKKNFSQPKLTIGLDLGDRSSWYCLLDEVGEVLQQQKLSTTPKAMREVFGSMPRCRLGLETGMHSPWVNRVLMELGHEVIVAHARNVRLIGESRKKDDRLDAGTLARLARIDPRLLCRVKHRSAKAQADPDGDPGASRAGTSADRAGEHGARARQEPRRAAARVQCAQYESRESRGSEPGTASRTAVVAGGARVLERADSRVQRADREVGGGKLSAGGAAEADQGSREHHTSWDRSVSTATCDAGG